MIEKNISLVNLPHQFPFRFIKNIKIYVPNTLLMSYIHYPKMEELIGGTTIPTSLLIEGIAQNAVIFTQLETKPIEENEFPLFGNV